MTAEELPAWFFRVLAFVMGATWGSFANVVIYRWPRELSVVRPASHCPHCDKPVRPYDNLPILAWFWLRGKCRDCKAPIAPRYAFVEALYAVASLAVVELLLRTQGELAFPVFLAVFFVRFAFLWGLLTASFIDLDTMLIPDFISLGGTALGLVASVLLPGIGWRGSLGGAAAGFGIPFAFYFVWSRFLKREGMGLGDAKLLAMVGALLGPHAVLFSLCAGSMQGIIATVVSKVTGWQLAPDIDDEDDDEVEAGAPRADAVEPAPALPTEPEAAPPLMRTRIPFGPFLALGAIEYLLGGDRLMQAYLTFLRGE